MGNDQRVAADPARDSVAIVNERMKGFLRMAMDLGDDSADLAGTGEAPCDPLTFGEWDHEPVDSGLLFGDDRGRDPGWIKRATPENDPFVANGGPCCAGALEWRIGLRRE